MACQRLETTSSIERNHRIDGIEADRTGRLQPFQQLIAPRGPELCSQFLASIRRLDDKQAHKSELVMVTDDRPTTHHLAL